MADTPPEVLKAAGELADKITQMLTGVAGRFQGEILRVLQPEIDTLHAKMNRKLLPSDSRERRLEAVREFIFEFESLLEELELHLTLRGESFVVKGFTRD